MDLEKLMVVAAVVALVAGLGWVIHAGNGGSVSKSSSDGTVLASSAAAAASSPAGTSAAAGQPIPRTAAAGCSWPAPTSAVTVRAPARVHDGAAVIVHVRLTGRAASIVLSPLVVAVQNGQVVGRLATTAIPPGPSLRPSATASISTDLTGTLRRSTCAQATAQAHGPQVPRGLALPPGRYQLIAVVAAGTPGPTGTAVSAPITVTVVR